MSKETAFYHDELCFWHTTGESVLVLPIGGWVQPSTGGGHAESPESKRRLVALMEVSGLMKQLTHLSADPATEEDILRVHTPDYVRKFKELSDAGGGEVGAFAPFGAGSFEIAALSAGLAKQAVSDVYTGNYKNAYSLSRPPGHHCLADQSMGFCLFANIPIAIEAAKANHGLGKVAVVDWDVHHGNGTQAIFYDRSDVLTISLHQENCFPPGSGPITERGSGVGEGYNINIPLLPGAGHEGYMAAMDKIVLPALHKFQPELIIVASGLDANGFDPLARMLLHSESYRELTQKIMQTADDLCEGKVVVVHEGGYAEAYVPFCGIALLEQLAGYKTEVEDPMLSLIQAQQPTLPFNTLQQQLLAEQAPEMLEGIFTA